MRSGGPRSVGADLPAAYRDSRRRYGDVTTMSAKFLHPAGRGGVSRGARPASRPCAFGGMGRACCCPAWPVVQVVMPATNGRPHLTELLLCAHHYRVSRRPLDIVGALAFVLPGCPEDALLGADSRESGSLFS